MGFFVCIQRTTRIREDQSFFDRLIECDIQEPVITVNREVAFELGLFTQVSDETFHETGIYVFKQALRHIVSKMIGQTS